MVAPVCRQRPWHPTLLFCHPQAEPEERLERHLPHQHFKQEEAGKRKLGARSQILFIILLDQFCLHFVRQDLGVRSKFLGKQWYNY